MYTRSKEYGRPIKSYSINLVSALQEGNFEDNENALFDKIVHIDSNNCFVKSVDFQKGRIFLYTVSTGRVV